MKLIILSDIHANLSALNSVIADFEEKRYNPDAIAILGDNINYGMRPNETIKRLKDLAHKYHITVNIFGNHEKALIDGDTSHFSTERGKQVLDYTRRQLSSDSLEYIRNLDSRGLTEMEIGSKNVLFVHGNIEDVFWGKLNNDIVSDIAYLKYDYVISGHSHVPHMIEHFFVIDNPEYRNKKRTIFINPGSVGQPRNHNPRAQYAYVDLKEEICHFNSVSYDIDAEQKLFNESVNRFYADRLTKGV